MEESNIKRYCASDILNFGKNKGKTVKEIYKIDAQYLIWCIENNIFSLTPQYIGKIKYQAEYDRKHYRYCSDYSIHSWTEYMMENNIDIGPNI